MLWKEKCYFEIEIEIIFAKGERNWVYEINVRLIIYRERREIHQTISKDVSYWNVNKESEI